MIRIQGIRLAVRQMDERAALRKKAASALNLPAGQIAGLTILKKAVDARDKHHLLYTYTLAVSVPGEEKILARNRSRRISRYTPASYRLPAAGKVTSERPVIVGAGPAGLFCALILCELGVKPILIERGKEIDQRVRDVQRFFRDGVLDKNSNIQFGEGGAGTFSDGKLNTGTKDPRQRLVLERFVRYGAPAQILYDAKPHIGTDRLRRVITEMRRELTARGCDIRFSHQLTGLDVDGGKLCGVRVSALQGEQTLKTSHLVLAIGHSARDTLEMLHDTGLAMRGKRFAVGVRLEQKQAHINDVFYGSGEQARLLGAASFKLSYHTDAAHRGVFSFCVCPGGTVVAAASEHGRVVTNGMSVYRRDGENGNGAILVEIGPEDYGTDHPLAGMYYQRQLEQAAFLAGGGDYRAPAQLAGDFLAGRRSHTLGRVQPTYLPGVRLGDLSECLPAVIVEALREGLMAFEARIPGFLQPDALLTAVESRSSSPVRMERGADYSANIAGVYPCAEGAGYAGGILSAAVDGIRCAEALYRSL